MANTASSENHPLKEYSIIVLGSGGVGKSALTWQFVSGVFRDYYDATIQEEYDKTVIVDNKPAKICILDTAGQEEFRSITDQAIREGNGFLMVYSITSKLSFQDIDDIYARIDRIKEDEMSNISIVVAANKCDLEESRQVTKSEGLILAKRLNAKYFETSAKTFINVNDCFEEIIRSLRKTDGSPNDNNTQGNSDCDIVNQCCRGCCLSCDACKKGCERWCQIL